MIPGFTNDLPMFSPFSSRKPTTFRFSSGREIISRVSEIPAGPVPTINTRSGRCSNASALSSSRRQPSENAKIVGAASAAMPRPRLSGGGKEKKRGRTPQGEPEGRSRPGKHFLWPFTNLKTYKNEEKKAEAPNQNPP